MLPDFDRNAYMNKTALKICYKNTTAMIKIQLERNESILNLSRSILIFLYIHNAVYSQI